MTPERFEKLKLTLRKRQPDLSVLLEKVHKPHNIAAIFRSCDAVGIFNVNAIAAPKHNFRDFKADAGARRWLQATMHDSLDRAYKSLRKKGMRIVAAHPSNTAIDFRQYDYTQPTSIVLGTELYGLTDEAIEAADETVFIPMLGMAQSLNVSVCAALILYEAQRQRQAAGLYDKLSLDNATFRNTLFEWAWPRIAKYCRKRRIPYPEVDLDSGDIKQSFTRQ